MTAKYAVTFEFDEAQPMTHRGIVTGSSAPTCFARAVRAAVRAHRHTKWTSMLCLLLERLPDAKTPRVDNAATM
jgi:hypothetical protein